MKKKEIGVFIILILLIGNLGFGSAIVGFNLTRGKVIYSTQTTTGGNISSFLDLTDTPNSYAGQGGNCVKVMLAETGLEFGSCSVVATETDPLWSVNKTNWNDCPAGQYQYGAFSNGTAKCRADVDTDTDTFNTTTDFNAWLLTKTTDNLAQGTTNKYDNQSWNESRANTLYYLLTNPLNFVNHTTNSSYYLFSNPFGFFNVSHNNFNKTYADTLYAPIGSAGDNSSWNESYANTLYYSKTNPLNFLNHTTNSSYYLNSNPFNFYNSTTIPASVYTIGQNSTWEGNQTRIENNIIANGSIQRHDQDLNITSNVTFNYLNVTKTIYHPFNEKHCWGNATHPCWAWTLGNATGFFAWGGG